MNTFFRIIVLGALIAAVDVAPSPVEVLKATGGLPPHVVGRFLDPVRFVETKTGDFLVLDRRGHTVYGVDRGRTTVRKILQVGFEQGKLLQPAVLALSADDIFAVADAPSGMERIQYFGTDGTAIGGFYLPSRVLPRLTIGPLVLNGVGSMEFTGKTFLINQPESGALVSELDVQGRVLRHFGFLRATGHEADRDLHVALNVGLPLVDPRGGFYFVFQTGRPMFRKYDASGTLVFERHIEGTEIDGQIQSLPTTWPRRTDERSVPLVSPLVRTAAVDGSGRLWVSLMVPFTYVYDTGGDKTRTVQFQAAGLIAPTSLFFAPRDRVLVTPGCYEFSIK